MFVDPETKQNKHGHMETHTHTHVEKKREKKSRFTAKKTFPQSSSCLDFFSFFFTHTYVDYFLISVVVVVIVDKLFFMGYQYTHKMIKNWKKWPL